MNTRSWLAGTWWLVLVAFLVLSLLPNRYLQHRVFDWWDKAQHASAFAALAMLGLRCWPKSAWGVLFGLLMYGAAIEWLQHLTGWRRGEWSDLAADAVGLGLAAVCSRFFQQHDCEMS